MHCPGRRKQARAQNRQSQPRSTEAGVGVYVFTHTYTVKRDYLTLGAEELGTIYIFS